MNKNAEGDIADMLRYADNENLLVLCWAVGQFWDPGRNWDELPPTDFRRHDERMKRMANAWESGGLHLSKQLNFEPRNFLMWGYSNSAQFAGRLALKKPQYFGAVHMHNPRSFDKPNADATRIVWSLTMGEVDSAYGRASRFKQQCAQLGYILFYKAVPGMGHANDRASRQFATLVFEWARGLPTDPKERWRKARSDMASAPFVGDWLNQNIEASAERDFIPAQLQVPLPTPLLAKSWARDVPLSRNEDPANAKKATPKK